MVLICREDRPCLVRRKSIGKIEESSSYGFFFHCSRVWNKGMNGYIFFLERRAILYFWRKENIHAELRECFLRRLRVRSRANQAHDDGFCYRSEEEKKTTTVVYSSH